ncbi:hypothetical protein KPH14_005410 [Odynerus spinipes]|uniref:Uncharacterized protein n=1 Tax=Odynerus spinipes TaxID=1348599 RepID=A0AAD9RBQ3_9HYME|nr:hypothetical protein KPH14_005410 [Odynerus spinipes]
MAASAQSESHAVNVEKRASTVLEHVSMNTCPPTNFPDKFQDFFAAVTEDNDDLPNMLEDKLIPRKQEDSGGDAKGRKWSKRAFQRRSSEIEVRLHRSSLSGAQGHGSLDGPKSPTPTRRRSSSIAVARPTPDLHRFLQAEAGPWGHLSPSPRSPSLTPAVSPGAASTSSHLSPGTSPGGPSPTSPAGSVGQGPGSRVPAPRQYRGRTSSMPAVPRHRVSRNTHVRNQFPDLPF